MTQPSISIVLLLSFSYVKRQTYYNSQCTCWYLYFISIIDKSFNSHTSPAARNHPYPYSTTTSNEVFILASTWVIHLQKSHFRVSFLKTFLLETVLARVSLNQTLRWELHAESLLERPLERDTHKGVRKIGLGRGRDGPVRWLQLRPHSAYFTRSSGDRWPFRVVANWGKTARFLCLHVSLSAGGGEDNFTLR